MRFYDEFKELNNIEDSNLNEAREPSLTEAEFAEIFDRCIKNLESLDDEFVIDWSVVSFDGFFHGNNCFGQCLLGASRTGDSFKMSIRLNKNLLHESLKDMIENNILHEFCHYFQNRDAISAGFYKLSSDGDLVVNDDIDQKMYFEGRPEDTGHSPCWWHYVDIINSKLKPALPITATVPADIHKRFITELSDDVIFAIKCRNCDTAANFIDYSPDDTPEGFIETLYIHTKENKSNTYCGKCGGTLYIEIYDRQFEAELKEHIRRLSFLASMSAMFGRRLNKYDA